MADFKFLTDLELALEDRDMLIAADKSVKVLLEALEKEKEEVEVEAEARPRPGTDIKNQISDTCLRVQARLDDFLKNKNSVEVQVVLLMKKAEYFSNLASVSDGNAHATLLDEATRFYEKALKIGQAELNLGHSVFLRVVYEYATFCSDSLKDVSKAVALAKGAVGQSSDHVKGDSNQGAGNVLTKIEEMLEFWNVEGQEHPLLDEKFLEARRKLSNDLASNLSSAN